MSAIARGGADHNGRHTGRGRVSRIPADLGKQTGSDLFHSFGQFSILSGESATFSGPDSVSNITSRVTGGDISQTDGLLRSEIPGADMWLLNPAGVMFGAEASLDIGASLSGIWI
ncbi:MAG: hypothetical protein B6245_05760 [Desulfobacteraceae bacterium 4572_88]|nr:MAG: hypothetical protein B6245_05760 [Desulfobacteraceae bacterium 4572_88]